MMRLFLLGDSTCAPKEETVRPETGWGECLKAHLPPDWTVFNRAINGRSTKQVLDEGTFEQVLEDLCPGDMVLIQFGHNESKPDEVRHTEPWSTFSDNLRYMVGQVRKHGGTVVFATPVVRRRFADGCLVDTHGSYPDAMKHVADQLQVPLIDVQLKSSRLVADLGEERSCTLYLHQAPGQSANYPQGVADNTHLSPLGADAVAEMVAPYLLRFAGDGSSPRRWK